MFTTPHPPTDGSTTSSEHAGTYKTSQLRIRRDRFNKPGTCKSAPLDHRRASADSLHSHSTTEVVDQSHGIKPSSSHMSAEYSPYQATNAEVEVKDEGQDKADPTQGEAIRSSDPILSYITTARLRLGLPVESDRHSVETSRESVVVSSGPIAGIRDLRLLSRRLSSLQAVLDQDTAVQGEGSSGDFVYCLRGDLGSLKVRCNPYDLRIVESEEARVQGRYYTVSAFSVAEVST